jgi:hypothetical protein
MIIKTERFNNMMLKDVQLLAINPSVPLTLIGSYPDKLYGSLINDVDFNDYVYYNQTLLNILIKNIQKTEQKGLFIFMYLNCGKYIEFSLPWNIDSVGGCDFDYLKVKDWFENFKTKNLVDIEKINFISKKLNSKNLLIKDILEIEEILDSSSKIVWLKEDIIRGYKTVRGITYNLLELLKEVDQTVCKYIYKYTTENAKNEFINIEIGLVNKSKKRKGFRRKISPYYLEDWYSVLKSYRRNLNDEDKKQYFTDLYEVEEKLALRSQLELTRKIIKHKLLPPNIVKEIMLDSKQIMDKLDVNYKGLKADEIEKNLTNEINDYAHNLITYYKNKIKDDLRPIYEMYWDRSLQARESVSIDELIKKRSNLLCPFYDIDFEEFQYLYTLANRLLYPPLRFIDCFIKAAKSLDMSIPDLIIQGINQNQMSIVSRDIYLYLYNRDQEIGEFSKGDKKRLIYLIITGEELE